MKEQLCDSVFIERGISIESVKSPLENQTMKERHLRPFFSLSGQRRNEKNYWGIRGRELLCLTDTKSNENSQKKKSTSIKNLMPSSLLYIMLFQLLVLREMRSLTFIVISSFQFPHGLPSFSFLTQQTHPFGGGKFCIKVEGGSQRVAKTFTTKHRGQNHKIKGRQNPR